MLDLQVATPIQQSVNGFQHLSGMQDPQSGMNIMSNSHVRSTMFMSQSHQQNDDVLAMILQRLDSVDGKQLHRISACVNQLTDRMNSIEQKVNSIEKNMKTVTQYDSGNW